MSWSKNKVFRTTRCSYLGVTIGEKGFKKYGEERFKTLVKASWAVLAAAWVLAIFGTDVKELLLLAIAYLLFGILSILDAMIEKLDKATEPIHYYTRKKTGE